MVIKGDRTEGAPRGRVKLDGARCSFEMTFIHDGYLPLSEFIDLLRAEYYIDWSIYECCIHIGLDRYSFGNDELNAKQQISESCR